MRRLSPLLCILFFTVANGAEKKQEIEGGFRGVKWGQSFSQVKAAFRDAVPQTNKDGTYLSLSSSTLAGYPANISLVFTDKKFSGVQATLDIEQNLDDPTPYKLMCADVRSQLAKKYGQPASNEEPDDLMGYSLEVAWKSDDTAIALSCWSAQIILINYKSIALDKSLSDL